MTRVRYVLITALMSALATVNPLAAQGTLSGLGFGYPVGGTSTRTAGTGGSFGEFDPFSPLNPASLGVITRTAIAVQAEPEYRTLHVGSVSEKTTAQRVPLLMLAVPMKHDVGIGLSATTFLDRSYTTFTPGEVIIDGKPVSTTDESDVRGSMADIRLASGWRINGRFSVGLGFHMFTGDNLVIGSRTFADSTQFGNVLDSSRVLYFGTAISAGGEWRIRKGLAAMLSYRNGFGINARQRDTTLATATVPNRLGVGFRYDGIRGSIFAVGVDHQNWTQMAGLGSSVVETHDATNWHAGAEVAGPELRGSPLLVRVGFARNTLPFGVSNSVVNESRYTTGIGIPVAREQATIDLSIQRASRTLVSGGAKESSWMLGVGLQIRP